MQALGDLPGSGFRSLAMDVSADGSVVVGQGVSDEGIEAFRWTQGGGMEGLGDLPGGTFGSIANAVSADGSVVVGSSFGETGFHEAFRWVGGSMEHLGFLPGSNFFSIANGVSADGTVVVGDGLDSAGDDQAFRWTAVSGMVGLGFPSQARGVSADGSVIVGNGASDEGTEAFRWTEESGRENLGDLDGGIFSSIAYAVSSDGSVVVGESRGNNSTEAFIWTEVSGMRALKTVLEDDYGVDLTGWTLTSARGVSDDGTVIVGYGSNPDGDGASWRAEIVAPAIWLDPISGFFNEPTRWSTNDIPSEENPALFNAFTESFYTVTFVQNQTTHSLTIDSTEVRFELGGATYTLAQATGDAVRVGIHEDRPGGLSLEGGTITADHAVVGQSAGSEGGLLLGIYGDAATLDLDGIATIGRGGTANLGLYPGSTATVRRGLWIAEDEGSTGSVLVRGGLLQITEGTDGTFIGMSGVGSLEVTGSASFVGIVNVGNTSSGNGTLTLSSVSGGSSVTTHNLLQVGVAGVGGLEITDGSVLTSADVILGLQPGSFGTALVDGAGSRWEISNSSRIGVGGAALLQIQNGATLCFNSFDHQVGAQGTVQISGSVVIGGVGCPNQVLAGAATKRSGSSLLTTPALFLAEGSELDADAVMLEDGGMLGGSGTLDLPITSGGIIAPGGIDSTGVFMLDNEYTQTTGGVLEIEFGGVAPGEGYDRLAVNGDATLGGTLRLDRIMGYRPQTGETYTLLTAGSVTGTFETIEEPADVDLDIRYTATEVTATVTSVSVSNQPDEDLPQTHILHAAYPNPFNPQAVIPFEVAETGPVRLAVYDLLGREVSVLVDGRVPAGTHEAVVDARGLASGMYVIRMTTGDGFAQSRQVMLLR